MNRRNATAVSLIALTLGIGIIAGCADLQGVLTGSTQDQSQGSFGKVLFQIALPSSERQIAGVLDVVDRIELSLSGSALSTPLSSTISKSEISSGGASATIERVPPGQLLLSASVLDGIGNVLATGSAPVTVVAGRQATANMTLTIPTTGSVGSTITLEEGSPVPGASPSPSSFSFSPTAQLTGKITYDGSPLEFADDNYDPVMKIKEPGLTLLGHSSAVFENQYFQYVGLTESKPYQVVWDYQGQPPASAAAINTIRLFVSDPITASAVAVDPMVAMDIMWETKASPNYGAYIHPTTDNPVSFSFSKVPHLDAEYQVDVFDVNGARQWSSAWLTSSSVSWNGRKGTETNTPTGAEISPGSYSYSIKFRKVGGTFGGANYYGESFRIPLQKSLSGPVIND